MSIKIANDTANGSVTLKGQNVAGDRTITMPNLDCELAPRMQLMTAQNSTSGTSIDFTGIPSWAKKITVMFAGVSTNVTSSICVQIGDSGGIENTGYICTYVGFGGTNNVVGGINSNMFPVGMTSISTGSTHGMCILTLIESNTWVEFASTARAQELYLFTSSGSKTLSSTLDRIRITTVNGTDTFAAGQINVLYEG